MTKSAKQLIILTCLFLLAGSLSAFDLTINRGVLTNNDVQAQPWDDSGELQPLQLGRFGGPQGNYLGDPTELVWGPTVSVDTNISTGKHLFTSDDRQDGWSERVSLRDLLDWDSSKSDSPWKWWTAPSQTLSDMSFLTDSKWSAVWAEIDLKSEALRDPE